MILQGGPPDTVAYYHVAYVWVVVLYVGYIGILWSRARRVRSRLVALENERARERREP